MPASVWKVPPEVPNATPRLAFKVIVDVVSSVPPLRVNCPAVAAPGAVPRLASAETARVPALIVVDPL